MKNTRSSAPARHLVSLAEAARYADVKPLTVRRWISAGRLPAYRVGPKLLKIDLNELETMLRPVPTSNQS